MNDFLTHTGKLVRYYRTLGEKAFAQLSEDEMFWTPGATSNSIAIIVQHLHGNMLSRWTDFLTTDGEKTWRNRGSEFNLSFGSKGEVLDRWDEGWSCFLKALDELKPGDLEKIIYIRNEGHSVADAVQRQVAHYAYHIGQIIFIAKLLKGDAWVSLSIPKEQSESYNKVKFEQPKELRYFTDNE